MAVSAFSPPVRSTPRTPGWRISAPTPTWRRYASGPGGWLQGREGGLPGRRRRSAHHRDLRGRRRVLSKIGLNVDYVSTRLGHRGAAHFHKAADREGGWSIFGSMWGGMDWDNPAGNAALRGNGKNAWFGWPTARNWSRCATSGCTRLTRRRRSRWPPTCSARPSSTPPACRSVVLPTGGLSGRPDRDDEGADPVHRRETRLTDVALEGPSPTPAATCASVAASLFRSRRTCGWRSGCTAWRCIWHRYGYLRSWAVVIDQGSYPVRGRRVRGRGKATPEWRELKRWTEQNCSVAVAPPRRIKVVRRECYFEQRERHGDLVQRAVSDCCARNDTIWALSICRGPIWRGP